MSSTLFICISEETVKYPNRLLMSTKKINEMHKKCHVSCDLEMIYHFNNIVDLILTEFRKNGKRERSFRRVD